MGSKLKVAPVKSFVGGLNVYSNATQVGDDESPDMINCDFVGLTGITRRKGYVQLISSAANGTNSIPGAFSYITSSVREILYASGGNLYKYNGSGGSTLISSSVFTGTPVRAAQVGDRLYFATGADALKYYNGTSVVTTGITDAPTTPSEVISFNDRLYTNSTANKDRVYYGQPLTSTGASTNTGIFTTGADSGFFLYGIGKEVSGFSKLGTSGSNALYIFLRDSIMRATPSVVSSTTVHTNVVISNSIGCRAPMTIQNVENDVLFLDSTVYSLGEVGSYTSLRTKNVSAKVERLFDGMSQSSFSTAVGVYYEKEQAYLLSINVNGTNNDHLVVYSVPYKAWTYWDNIEAACFLTYIDSTGEKHLYFGSADSSYVFELYQGLADNGGSYTSRYRTKEFDLNQFNIEKIFQNWNLQFGGVYGTITVRFYVDGTLVDTAIFVSGTNTSTADGIGTSVLGTFAIGREGNYTDSTEVGATANNDWRWRDLGGTQGTTFQFEFEMSAINESFEIKQANVGIIELPYYKRSANRQV
jgi:hypothetical protein